ncbi:Mannose-1-phosphate guanylyltransferase (GDP) [Methylophaga frappieri]|uniref:mannose-1-phosphate guanylyltransferase n=1 Tax=Methylophaga frappieri (strain ATCC BAA-2434 / DSM 25690 / JAM7) TaxID=754477 RepID=I1YKH9_METFJ|nr:mannose-1-phosphate guanylyltransferase/mannose-6-phosphate isomerase [Methylophaga frappieri]AFJ03422.1 Mannose-1-phosphate guanylyltransferase (GDP) [Methylophaga frappieri]
MNKPTKLISVIMCGGAGSRLWPLSRAEHPKPFIEMPDRQSLIKKAALRAAALPGAVELLVVSNEALLFNLHDEIAPVIAPDQKLTYLLEPVAKNTTAAIAAAVHRIIAVHGEDATLMVLSADHLIEDELAFANAVNEAVTLSAQDYLVSFGIKPDRPETGFGYLQITDDKVSKFIEKPQREEAEKLVASGDYYWNAGMFCFKASVMRQELAEYCPAILQATQKAVALSGQIRLNDALVLRLAAEHFQDIEDISIDYAVMEKTRHAAAVACDIGWHDVGSWQALSEIYEHDNDGNAIRAEVCLHQAKNSFFYSDDRLIGAVGVENLIIVDTPDAILVADKAASQDVRQIYKALKQQDHPTHRFHNKVYRPWGSYTVLEVADHYKIKRIEVNPGASLSLQSHQYRSEHWVVIEGTALVINDDKQLTIAQNESTYIHAGHKHRLSNPYTEKLVIIEVQTGDYVGEDDIKRYEDVYGRVRNLPA